MKLPLVKLRLDASVLKFAAMGVLNTVVGLGIIYLLKWLWAVSDNWANLIGYCVGFVVSCVGNARWTFQYRQALGAIVPRYALLIVAAYLVNLLVVRVAIDALAINSYLAQALGVAPYAALTYLGAKCWVFASSARS